MTDQDLLRAYAQSRDTQSLGAFVARHEDSLLRFTGRFLRDADAAQDVVQETFLQVARDPGRLLGVDSCRNWLLRVARNLGVSRIRRDARARRHAEAFREVAQAAAAERADLEAGALELEETRSRVRAEIDRLNPRYREVLLLKIQEDRSYREIAEITGETVTNVGYLLHQALRTLGPRLKRLEATREVRP